ncbi:UNVERIFIED_CONTAM: hypothetical protein PYX00_004731 [Menopon gallinae]|uniref:PDZ domain-containing protein n=1 Tax=Menopon gallinae TaxID=328185 RepID=A0AAW2I7M2_9NEOP
MMVMGEMIISVLSVPDFTLGVATVTLNPSLIEDLAQKGMYLPKYITGGLLIHNITEDSVAQMNGLQPGDVIFEVEGKPIKDLPQFLKMLSMKGKLRVRIYRSGGVFNVILVARRR